MKRAMILTLVVLGVLSVLCMPGCGNVELRGESLTAAEVSTVDALNAANRLRPDANAPHWAKALIRTTSGRASDLQLKKKTRKPKRLSLLRQIPSNSLAKTQNS